MTGQKKFSKGLGVRSIQSAEFNTINRRADLIWGECWVSYGSYSQLSIFARLEHVILV